MSLVSVIVSPCPVSPPLQLTLSQGNCFKILSASPLQSPRPNYRAKYPCAMSVARFDLEETMTEGSDVAADYSSDGREDRCEAVIGLEFICAITACAAL